MDLHLKGKCAIVTGAKSEIGLAIARSLAAEGVHLALVGRQSSGLLRAEAIVRLHGSPTIALTADLSDHASVERMVDTARLALGEISILVNAAARPPESLSFRSRDAITGRRDNDERVNNYLRCAQAVIPSMREANWGRIVNVTASDPQISRLMDRQAFPNTELLTMTRRLANDLGRNGINVSTVHPGVLATKQTRAMLEQQALKQGISEAVLASRFAESVSIGRLMTPNEVASVVTFLSSPVSVAITGGAIFASGGDYGRPSEATTE